MKKLFFVLTVLLSFVLLFSSCETDPPVKKESETTEEGTSVFQLASLPDIGSYESKEKYEYFYDTPLDTFVPSEDYGSLAVYTVQKSFTDAFGGKAKWDVYGFMTDEGRIITSPVYSSITYEENSGSGFYVAQSAESEGSFETSRYSYTLISADGSKMIDGGDLTDWFSGDCILIHFPDGCLRVYSPEFEPICEFDQTIALTEGETAMTMNFAGKAGSNYIFYNRDDSGEEIRYVIRVFNAQGKLIKTSPPVSFAPTRVLGNYLLCYSSDYVNSLLCDLDGNFVAEAPSWNYAYNEETDEYYFSGEDAEPGILVYDGDMREIRRIRADAFDGGSSFRQSPPYGCILGKTNENDSMIASDVAFYPADGSEPSVYHAGDGECFYRFGYFASALVLRYSDPGHKATLIDLAAGKELLTFDCGPIRTLDAYGEHLTVLTQSGELITIDENDPSFLARTELPMGYTEGGRLGFQSLKDTILLTCFGSERDDYIALIDIRTGEVYIEDEALYAQKTEDGYVLCYSDGAYTVTSDEKGKVLVCMNSQED